MVKNIILTFLSDVKTNVKDNAVFISETKYTNVDGENTHITNESAIRYLQQKYFNEKQTLDKIFIIASKKIRENDIATKDGKIFLLDDKPIKHLDYFKKRMRKFLPNIDTCITDKTICPYEEDSTSVENLKSVAEVAGRIQNYAEQVGEKVILHADLSGGMRHINMMMLDVIRLLEYSDIEIGKLLYSNYNSDKKIGTVEEVKDIYDLFQLISGVEEFVQFGSVKALEKYYDSGNYKDSLSVPLKKLINAMGNFAEAIKLCHYGQFSESIQNLHDAVRDFEADPANVQDVLMARLIGRIRKDYENLIVTRERDDVRIIRWCIDNGYMQQALTLYTERIPEYLGEMGCIVQTEEESKILDDLVHKDTMHRNRWYYLLNEVNPRTDHIYKGTKKYCEEIKNSAMSAIRKNKFDYDSWWKNLDTQLEKLNIFCADEPRLRKQFETFVKLRNDAEILLNLSSEELEPIREIIDELYTKLESQPKGFERNRCIVAFIMNELQNKDVYKFFPKLKFAKPLDRPVVEKYPNAFVLYEMMTDNIFSLKKSIPLELFLKIMDRYFRLKAERNQSNHAREDFGEFPTAQSLKEFMEEGLDELEEAKKLLIDEVI